MKRYLLFSLIFSVLILSIFSVSLAAAESSECNLWCKIVYLFTGKIQATTGAAVTEQENDCGLFCNILKFFTGNIIGLQGSRGIIIGTQSYGGYGGLLNTSLCGNGVVDVSNNETCDDGNVNVSQTCGVGACARTINDNCTNGPSAYHVWDNYCLINPCTPGSPTTEICNYVDDDCDGQVDEGVKVTFYRDADSDNYGNAANSVQDCSAPLGYVLDNTDCNDANSLVNPGATEICNDGIDNDCDTFIDSADPDCAPTCVNPITLTSGYSDSNIMCSGNNCVVQKDINFCADGIRIGADNIVLDCNGYTLTGTGDGISPGFYSSFSGVTIRDCRLSGFYQGIVTVKGDASVSSSGNTIINNILINDHDPNSIGILLWSSSNNLISSNLIDSFAEGIKLYKISSNNNISDNIVNNSFYGPGISLESYNNQNNNNNIIKRNTMSNSYSYGIWIKAGNSNNRVYYNNLINNGLAWPAQPGAYDDDAVNIWDDEVCAGNYWSHTRYANTNDRFNLTSPWPNGYDLNSNGIADCAEAPPACSEITDPDICPAVDDCSWVTVSEDKCVPGQGPGHCSVTCGTNVECCQPWLPYGCYIEVLNPNPPEVYICMGELNCSSINSSSICDNSIDGGCQWQQGTGYCTSCGNGQCDSGETVDTCPQDCTCEQITDETICPAVDDCNWVDTGECTYNCSDYGESACISDKGCQWTVEESCQGTLDSWCSMFGNPQDCALTSPDCTWQPGTCVGAIDCSKLSGGYSAYCENYGTPGGPDYTGCTLTGTECTGIGDCGSCNVYMHEPCCNFYAQLGAGCSWVLGSCVPVVTCNSKCDDDPICCAQALSPNNPCTWQSGGTGSCGFIDAPVQCDGNSEASCNAAGCQFTITGGYCTSCVPSTEICNGIDDDCDGLIDEDLETITYCGIGVCNTTGLIICSNGQLNNTCAPVCNDSDLDGWPDECVGYTGTRGEGYGQEFYGSGQGYGQYYNFNGEIGSPSFWDTLKNSFMDVYNFIGSGLGFRIGGGPGNEFGYGAGYGYEYCKRDCNDNNASINPNATEICDGIDNNCDGSIDEGCQCTPPGSTKPCDNVLGECSGGIQICSGGAWSVCNKLPSLEICDGLDNDCDGQVDEELGSTTCGQGACYHTIQNCVGGTWQICNPYEGSSPETCNGIDDDCDGSIDEDLGSTTCGEGVCYHTVQNCIGGVWQTCDSNEGSSPEFCDGKDNDCDGQVDEYLGSTTCGTGVCQIAVQNCVGGVPQTCAPVCNDSDLDGWPDECVGYTGIRGEGYGQESYGSGQGYGQYYNFNGEIGSPSFWDTLKNSFMDVYNFIGSGLGFRIGGGPGDNQGYGTGYGYEYCKKDCNDDPNNGGASINPGATEICNNVDDNCDGNIDENNADCSGQTPYCVAGSCVHCINDAQCDDGFFCNGAETCAAGSCQDGIAPTIDDGISCTIDNCDEINNIVTHTADDSLCQNGLYCDGAETCNAQSGCQAGIAPNCADAYPCTIDSCNEGTNTTDNIGTCEHDTSQCTCTTDAQCDDSNQCTVDKCINYDCKHFNYGEGCDDGLFCTVNDHCSEGECTAIPRPVDDNIACTIDSCDEDLNSVIHNPDNSLCDDSFWCTGMETCDAVLGCQAGTAPNCADAFACTDDSCNEGTDSCLHTANNTICPSAGSCDDSTGFFWTGVCDVAYGESDSGCVRQQSFATETTCDNVDDDCDGSIDEDYPTGTPTACGFERCSAIGTLSCINGNVSDSCTPGLPLPFYRDVDIDSYGNAADVIYSCNYTVNGYVIYENTDCNDNNQDINPGAKDVCDINNNVINMDCNASNDGERNCASYCGDTDRDGYVADTMPEDWNGFKSIICPWIVDTGDCDDNDNTAYPNAPEICDGNLENCTSGIIDKGCSGADKESALAVLKTLSTSDSKSKKELQDGIKWLTESLGNRIDGGDKKIVWLDSAHIACKHGYKVFDDEKKAVEHLQKVTDYAIIAQVNQVINSIVKADRLLAQTAINEAAFTKERLKAIANFNKGEAATDLKHKIHYYRKAWKYVNKHCEKKEKASCIDEITLTSSTGEIISAIGDEIGYPDTVLTDINDNNIVVKTNCGKCMKVGDVINGWTITELVDDGTLALKCAKK